MKASEENNYTHIYFKFFVTLLVFFFQLQVSAQDEKGANAETEELITPRLSFVSVQKNDQTIDLKVTAKLKVKKTFNPLEGIPIKFFNATETEPKLLGESVTDLNGVSIITISSANLPLDEDGKMRFTAQFNGNSKISAGEEEVYIKKARIEVTPVKEDSVLSVQVHLVDASQSDETTIPETGIEVYVKRTFFPLKVGEGASDENGDLVMEFPSDLPGDTKGNLTIIVRVEDSEEYGNLETNVIAAWGVPVSNEITVAKRELWSPSPPLWMLLTFFILMAAVWGHYFIIIYKLVKLKNL